MGPKTLVGNAPGGNDVFTYRVAGRIFEYRDGCPGMPAEITHRRCAPRRLNQVATDVTSINSTLNSLKQALGL